MMLALINTAKSNSNASLATIRWYTVVNMASLHNSLQGGVCKLLLMHPYAGCVMLISIYVELQYSLHNIGVRCMKEETSRQCV